LLDIDTNNEVHSSEVYFVETLASNEIKAKAPPAAPFAEYMGRGSAESDTTKTPKPEAESMPEMPSILARNDEDTSKEIDTETMIETRKRAERSEDEYNPSGSDAESVDELTLLANTKEKRRKTTATILNRLYSMVTHALLTDSQEHDNPTFEKAMNGPFKKEFTESILKEYASLEQHKVFSKPMPLPPGFRPLDTKMVLKRKDEEYENGPRKFKARLCGKGFKQEYGVDYFDTFAPVAAYDSIRAFLTLMAVLDYEIDVVDVITAFLLSVLKEEIYIKIPDGYPVKESEKGMFIWFETSSERLER
jgi:hypothetical protein